MFGKEKISAIEKEWLNANKREMRFLDKNREKKVSIINEKIEKYVPSKLETTLNMGFEKAFEVVFNKGTAIIEKTYNKKDREDLHKVQEFAMDLKKDAKSTKAFRRQSQKNRTVNLALSTIEGGGFGLIGMGVPDIPIFTSLLLKSIYEIAINYGFEYNTEEEQIFILKLIETSLLSGKELKENNDMINKWMKEESVNSESSLNIEKAEQIRKTARAISQELLYMKFIQGIPVAGIIGGISDVKYLKKITDYAEIKYNERFILKKTK